MKTDFAKGPVPSRPENSAPSNPSLTEIIRRDTTKGREPGVDTLRLYRVNNNRVLVADDNPSIHQDFRKILCGRAATTELAEAEAALFGEPQAAPQPTAGFQVDSAFQGQEALEKAQQALAAGAPYALAFMDVRMPPGWDGIETVRQIWQVYPELQVVICTAYSDYSWDEMIGKLGPSENLVILKKPFDKVEVLQLACALTRKWELNRQARLKLGELTRMVDQRTSELEAANRELKREMQERIEAERQLRHAQKMEAVGQLAAGVAHDFNNILTIIHGHASMLGMRFGQSGDHSRSISEIRRSAERAANLVRQLLAFSRKQVFQFRPVELNEVIRSVNGVLRELLGAHIELETHCAPGLPPIIADRGMIEQVIVNLTVNGRDAMPRGGRMTIKSSLATIDPLEVGTSSDSQPGQFVCLTISDTGSGMTPEVLGHLFEPFFTTKDIGKGTGLGLATVYGIVKQHHGWVDVQTQVNRGTAFRVFFPVSDHKEEAVAEPTPEGANAPGTETILLAEDEQALREMVAEVLTLRGYRVLAAESGPKALELYHQNSHVDLLLTDMVMPGGMMGSDLVAELRRTNPNLKVIYTTGYSPGVVGLQEAVNEGVNFLPKPYSPRKLADYIRQCLDG